MVLIHLKGVLLSQWSEEDFNDIISRLGFERCHIYFQRKFRYKSEIVRLCEKSSKKNLLKVE